jgi:hypothetical protein
MPLIFPIELNRSNFTNPSHPVCPAKKLRPSITTPVGSTNEAIPPIAAVGKSVYTSW